MLVHPENEINPYIKIYNNILPMYPKYKDITIHKTNNFYTTSLKKQSGWWNQHAPLEYVYKQ